MFGAPNKKSAESNHMNKKMISTLAAGALALPLCSTAYAGQQAGDWLVRLGVSQVAPDDDSESIPAIPDSGVEVDDGEAFSFTVTYMLSPSLGVELLAALPFSHDLEGSGAAPNSRIARIKHLPPTLSAVYFFNPQSHFRPYVGAGLNYTLIFDETTTGPIDGLDIDLDNSFGLAAQAGFDFDLNEHLFANLNVRWIDIDTEAEVEGLGKFDVDIDPWVFTAAIGMRF